MQPGILIRGKIVVGDAPIGAKILRLGPALRVRTGVTNRNPSAEATSPPPPLLGQGTRGLIIHQPGISGRQGFSPEVILLDLMQPSAAKGGMIALLNGPQANMTGLTEQNGTDTGGWATNFLLAWLMPVRPASGGLTGRQTTARSTRSLTIAPGPLVSGSIGMTCCASPVP